MAAQRGKVVRQIDQQLEAWRHAPAQPAVGAVEDLGAVADGQVDAIFALQAAARHHDAGIGDVRPVGGNGGIASRATIGGRGGRAQPRERRETPQQQNRRLARRAQAPRSVSDRKLG